MGCPQGNPEPDNSQNTQPYLTFPELFKPTPSGTGYMLIQRPPSWASLGAFPPDPSRHLCPLGSGWVSDFGQPAVGGRGQLSEGDPRTYSPRLADPRLLSAPSSRSRVADCDPNHGRLYGFASPSRVWNPLYRPLSRMCSPRHTAHTDLPSSPPSSHFDRGQFPMSARRCSMAT